MSDFENTFIFVLVKDTTFSAISLATPKINVKLSSGSFSNLFLLKLKGKLAFHVQNLLI